jgi:hypothetical protein
LVIIIIERDIIYLKKKECNIQEEEERERERERVFNGRKKKEGFVDI